MNTFALSVPQETLRPEDVQLLGPICSGSSAEGLRGRSLYVCRRLNQEQSTVRKMNVLHHNKGFSHKSCFCSDSQPVCVELNIYKVQSNFVTIRMTVDYLF